MICSTISLAVISVLFCGGSYAENRITVESVMCLIVHSRSYASGCLLFVCNVVQCSHVTMIILLFNNNNNVLEVALRFCML